jgi:hypothetical protein
MISQNLEYPDKNLLYNFIKWNIKDSRMRKKSWQNQFCINSQKLNGNFLLI